MSIAHAGSGALPGEQVDCPAGAAGVEAAHGPKVGRERELKREGPRCMGGALMRRVGGVWSRIGNVKRAADAAAYARLRSRRAARAREGPSLHAGASGRGMLEWRMPPEGLVGEPPA